MSLVTVPQVNPNDEVTALSVNQGPNAIAAVVNGNIDDANVSTLSGSKISSGTLTSASFDTNTNPETRESETIGDLVVNGLIWSATTGLGGTMTAGVAYIGGKRLVVSSVASYTFTASRDTYVYIDNTGSPQYNAQTNGATQPATPANNIIIAKVVTNGSTVTSVQDLRTLSQTNPSQSWTPTFTNLSGGTLNWSRFSIVGKRVKFRWKYTLGSAGVGSGVTFTLPIVAHADYSTGDISLGSSDYIDNGVQLYKGWASATNTTIARLFMNTVSGSNIIGTTNLSATVPFTWGAGDYIIVTGEYEAA